MQKDFFNLIHKDKGNSEVNRGYWDIHNHILPGIDDGSSCWEESYRLIREEHRQGVRNIILTPHYRPGMFQVESSVREHVYLRFCREIERYFPDMHFYFGCEYFAHDGMLRNLRDVRCRMAGTNAVLLEFSTAVHYKNMENVIKHLIKFGFQPIIAHVERYECLYKDTGRIYRLKDTGALIQINAGTVLEKRFSQKRKFVRILLDNDIVDFIASDAHNMKERPVRMKECIDAITKQYGMEKADLIFKQNPSRVFQKL